MIDISFEIGGKKVNPNNIGDALEKAILQSVVENITKKLSTVRCAEHGRQPQVKVKGHSTDKLSFEVKGCCQTLIDNSLKKLRKISGENNEWSAGSTSSCQARSRKGRMGCKTKGKNKISICCYHRHRHPIHEAYRVSGKIGNCGRSCRYNFWHFMDDTCNSIFWWGNEVAIQFD